jgi:hypothetical protein
MRGTGLRPLRFRFVTLRNHFDILSNIQQARHASGAMSIPGGMRIDPLPHAPGINLRWPRAAATARTRSARASSTPGTLAAVGWLDAMARGCARRGEERHAVKAADCGDAGATLLTAPRARGPGG